MISQITPNIPSDPTNSRVKSYPAEVLTISDTGLYVLWENDSIWRTRQVKGHVLIVILIDRAIKSRSLNKSTRSEMAFQNLFLVLHLLLAGIDYYTGDYPLISGEYLQPL